ncbi:MAG: response regulator [Bacteroidales bacterium]|nr:response regulator [Bacteroidales bacterium]
MENTISGLEFNFSEYKILIVDDVPSNVLLLKALLSIKQFQIVTANCGTACLEQVKAEVPDLILLDVMMPDMNGFEVARHLKNDPVYEAYKDIPIIFLTALNSAADIVKGFQAGANDFVLKPFNKDELMIRVMHQISLVAARRIIAEKNRALETTIRSREKMYSVIGHDLRSPIGTIKMLLEMLMDMLPVDKIGEENMMLISQCHEQTEETFSLLDNLLKWTKSQTGRLNVVHQEFKAADLLPSIVNTYRNGAALKGIELVYIEDPSDQVPLYADVDMCKTVIRNFVSNAVKFTPAGGTISIYTSMNPNGLVQMNVKDTGCGISEEDQSKLFNTKTHFTKYGTNAEEGSGLGLLLCMDFALKNGGELLFDSKENQGSTFSITVPVYDEEKMRSKVVIDDSTTRR